MLDHYTAKITSENRQQELLREAEKERLAQEVQADQIVTRWALGLLRRLIANRPESPKQPTELRTRKLIQEVTR
jgi:hypothetical protein